MNTNEHKSERAKGFPRVKGRVVMLWLGLIVAIAGLVVVTDRVARRDRSGGPPTSGPAMGTAPASAPRK